jgi:hypothetical protein
LKIVIAGVINGHVAAKSLYVRIFAGTDRMHKRDWVAMGSWVGIAFGLWVIAWVIAEAIPVFNNLLSLIVRVLHHLLWNQSLTCALNQQTALFGSWFTFGFTGMFWLHMNKGLWFSSPKKIMLTLLNSLAICVGVILVSISLGYIHEGKSTNLLLVCSRSLCVRIGHP